MPSHKPFPSTIAGFSFQRVLHPDQPYRRFALAEYVDQQGNVAIAKRLQGSRWQWNYYRFQNEIHFYESLNRLTPAQQTVLAEQFPHVRVPKYIATFGTGADRILVIEKVIGEPISSLPAMAQTKDYELLLAYLQRLGTHLTPWLRLPAWTTVYQILTLPAVTLRALRRSWADRRQIMALTMIVVRAVPRLLRDHRTTFVHRDLWPNNILVDGAGQITIIDFDVLAIMHPFVEIEKLTLGLWSDVATRTAWLGSLTMQSILQSAPDAYVFRALGAYTAVFEWGMPKVDRQVVLSYGTFLHTIGHQQRQSVQPPSSSNRPTVTVGIPAFNEGLSIGGLLASIITQQSTNYVLQEIVVLSDGSTDATAAAARAVNDPRIRVVDDPVRQGKPARMNELFATATTDIVVILDADISLAGEQCLAALIQPFHDHPEVSLVSGRGEPLPADTFIRRVATTGIAVWDRARSAADANDVYYCEGTIRAFHRRLYSELRFPAKSADDIYPYLYAQLHGFVFARAPQAIVHFTLPSRLGDYISQQSRFTASLRVHQENFEPDFVRRYFTVTWWIKFRALIAELMVRPVTTLVYAVLWGYVQWRNFVRPVETSSLWVIADSTKTLRHTVVFSSYDDMHNPYYGGGGAIAVHQVAKRLARTHEVIILTGKYPGAKNETVDGVHYRRIGLRWLGPKLGQLVFAFILPWYVVRLPHDVWIESFTPPFSTSCLQLFTRRQVIGLVHLLAGEEMYRKYGIPFYVLERLGLRTYRRFIVLSEAVAGTVRRSNPKAIIDIIRNGVDLATDFTTVPQPPYITFVGRIEMNQKGIDLLLQGFARVADQVPHTLAIAGSGMKSEVQKLEAMIHELGLEHRVALLGRVSGESKRALFAHSAFLVLPSRHETFSLVALEALAHHLPLVAFDIVGLEWLPSDCWVKVPAFDTEQLAVALQRVSHDPQLRKHLIERGSAFIQSFSWDQVASQYERSINASLQVV